MKYQNIGIIAGIIALIVGGLWAMDVFSPDDKTKEKGTDKATGESGSKPDENTTLPPSSTQTPAPKDATTELVTSAQRKIVGVPVTNQTGTSTVLVKI